MPVYLVHGFRWPRDGFTGIRVHAIVHNLEDCSVEYIQNEASKLSILQSLRQAHPEIMQHLEDPRTGRTLDFIEQYDPQDEVSDHAVSQTHAFVADFIVTIAAGTSKEAAGQESIPQLSQPIEPAALKLSSEDTSSKKSKTRSSVGSAHTATSATSLLHLNVEEVMSNSPVATPQARAALAQLRDKMAEGEKIGWWVVYNGDPERSFIDEEDDDETESAGGSHQTSDVEEDLELRDGKEDFQFADQTDGFAGHTILNQPLPSLIPPDMKISSLQESSKQKSKPATDITATAVPHPPTVARSEPAKSSADNTTSSKPKNNKSNFSFPLRRKSSKSNLPPPREDEIPEPPVLKEISKKEGRRYRFFGSKSDKKPA